MYSFKNISSLQADLKNGSITCTKVVNELFEQIEKTKNLNAYLEVFTESAKQQATEIDAKIKSGTHGKLAGVVIALKDNIAYKGYKVSASSKILENFTSLYNATVVDRLLAEDAILIGRTNCDEFAMGSSNENSAFGKVLNPVNTNTVPGGSSGGSAAVMAANLCHVALGSDTGGSIRQPASFCGVVGVKPTYGRVSRWGLLAYASSFDQIGPLTKTVEDAALVMEVIAGNDENDSTSSSKEVSKYTTQLNDSIKGTKVAYLKDCMESSGLNPEVKKRMEETIEKLKAEGVTVEGVNFPYLDYLVPAYYVLTTAEASSNLSRYDGVHYGYRSLNATDLESTYKKSRSEGFGKEVKRRIMLGTFVLSAGYYDAYYSKAQKVRRLLRDKTLEILSKYDFILTPSTPSVAFEFGKNSKDPIQMYLEDIFTVQANLVGVPAVSVPVGVNSANMPIGAQLMAKPFEEGKMLTISKVIESFNN